MTVSPGGYGPLYDQGRMLASTADRERALDVLKAGFAEGRLTQEEHDGRAGDVQTARTYGDLAGLTGDLPGGQWFVPAWQQPPLQQAPWQQAPWQPVPWQPAPPPLRSVPRPPAVDRGNQVAVAVTMMLLLVLFLGLMAAAMSG
jgi:Domain of unknown function (DUF1707)